jgi:predicted TIM-barrel fold metal-dependent hydrolase
MAPSDNAVVDIHTHMYPPSYISILEKRDKIPLVRTFKQAPEPRLILLESEVPALEEALKNPDAKPPGRPLTSHFASLAQKIHFMDTNHINISVISLANPWFDFLSSPEAGPVAESVNNEFSSMCSEHTGRLYFFAALPLTAPLETLRASIAHVKDLRYCRGVIFGTSGLGNGLDDPNLLPIFEAIAEAGLVIFLHPHYGLPNSVYGPRAEEYGHVLPLALGFPMETTITVTRMYLAGVFDKVRKLRMLLAHSGGTLPFLAGRIESCVIHDGQLVRDGKVPKDRRTVWDVLEEQIYLDAVIYSEVSLKAAIESSGVDRLMFGTDHPFFPPIEGDVQGEWDSSRLNAEAVDRAVGAGSKEAAGVMGANAIRVLRLDEE